MCADINIKTRDVQTLSPVSQNNTVEQVIPVCGWMRGFPALLQIKTDQKISETTKSFFLTPNFGNDLFWNSLTFTIQQHSTTTRVILYLGFCIEGCTKILHILKILLLPVKRLLV